MLSAALREEDLLAAFEPRWRRQGYTLVRDPRPEQLPAFLRGLRLDAVAVGASPALAIEIVKPRDRSSSAKLRQLQTLFEGRDDWRLEVVYLSPEQTPVEIVTPSEIEAGLRTAADLAKIDRRGGFLVGWAALEAAARSLAPALAEHGLSPGSLADLLVSQGLAEQAEGASIRELGALRDRLVHGQLTLVPSDAEVGRLLDLAARLTRLRDEEPHEQDGA